MGGGWLVIVCGLPGSGKTTLARRLERERAAIRLCPDEWLKELSLTLRDEGVRDRVERLQWELGKRLLDLGQTVIVEWGTWGAAERDRLREEARALDAGVELTVLKAPAKVLFRRIQRRAAEDPPIRWEEVQGWEAIFQRPTEEEAALFDCFNEIEAEAVDEDGPEH